MRTAELLQHKPGLHSDHWWLPTTSQLHLFCTTTALLRTILDSAIQDSRIHLLEVQLIGQLMRKIPGAKNGATTVTKHPGEGLARLVEVFCYQSQPLALCSEQLLWVIHLFFSRVLPDSLAYQFFFVNPLHLDKA